MSRSELTIDSDGVKRWYLNGKLHREDGPVVLRWDGNEEYWLDYKYLSFDEYKKWFIKKVTNPSYELTGGDIEFIKGCLE